MTAENDMSVRCPATVRCGLLLLFLAAGASNLLATANGPSITPDSCSYLSLADNVSSGFGYKSSITEWDWRTHGDTTPITFWPPVFPVSIGALHLAGLSLDCAARLVEAISFAFVVLGTAMLAGLLELRSAKRELRRPRGSVTVVAGALALLSAPLLRLSHVILSDTPFQALSLMAVYSFLRAGDENAPPAKATRWLGLASLLCSLALLTRYTGVALWATLLLGCFGIGAAMPRVARGRATLVMCGALAPLLAWMYRNASLTGNPFYGTARPNPSTWPGMLLETLKGTVSDVAPVPQFMSTAVRDMSGTASTILSVAATVTACLWLFTCRGAIRKVASRVHATPGSRFVLWAYGLTLVGILGPKAYFGEVLEQRYFTSALPFLLAVGVAAALPPVVGRAVERGYRAVRVALVVWACYSLLAGAVALVRARTPGDWSSEEAQKSAFATFLRGVDTPRFFTDLYEVWYLTRKPVRLLPRVGGSGDLRQVLDGDLQGAIVVFKGRYHRHAYRPTIEQMLDAGLLRRWERVASFAECEIFLRVR